MQFSRRMFVLRFSTRRVCGPSMKDQSYLHCDQLLATALVVVLTLLGQFVSIAPVTAQSSEMFGLVVKGKKFTGQILFRDSETLTLLRRDGALATYSSLDVDRVVELGKALHPYSSHELEKRLINEFSEDYSVRITDHFAVVYPSSSAFGWPRAFERLYGQFIYYFEARSFAMKSPEFPLIAVVLKTRAEFDRYLKQTALRDQSNVVGFYSMQSNRIVTYDQASLATGPGFNQDNLTTVIHEATHQSAYNTGIHARFQPLPRWVSEGLATMFEAKGVYSSAEFPEQRDRLAADYFRNLQHLIDTKTFRGKIESLVRNDEMFDADPRSAYAVAWGLTFFLAENRPEEYQSYMRHTAQRGSVSNFNAEHRLSEFSTVFGDEIRDLETRMIRFYENFRSKP